MFVYMNHISYLCSTETRERSGKFACLLPSHKQMHNLSNFGAYYRALYFMSEQSLSQLVKAAKSNDGFALTLLGVFLINGGQEISNGIEQVLHAADTKNVMWAKNIKRYLQTFRPWNFPIHHHALVDSDTIEQLDIYVDEGNMWAMTILGDLYYHGKVTVQNRNEAAILLSKAANKGCILAKELLLQYGIQRQYSFVSDIIRKFEDKDISRFFLKKE